MAQTALESLTFAKQDLGVRIDGNSKSQTDTSALLWPHGLILNKKLVYEGPNMPRSLGTLRL